MPGFKDSSGKVRLDLLPFGELEDVARVFEYGLEQPGYHKNNWQGVENGRELYMTAALRHMFRAMSGEPLDPKSRMSHLAHAACDVLMALWHEKREKK